MLRKAIRNIVRLLKMIYVPALALPTIEGQITSTPLHLIVQSEKHTVYFRIYLAHIVIQHIPHMREL